MPFQLLLSPKAKGGLIASQALEKDRKAKYVGKNIRGKTVLG